MMSVYSLTHMTGRPAQANRISVVQGFEAKRRTWFSLLAAGVVLVVVSAMAWPLLNVSGLLVGAAAGAGVMGALNVRSKAEPERLWVSARRDRVRSDAGRFFVCGREVDPTATSVYLLMTGTVRNPNLPAEPQETL